MNILVAGFPYVREEYFATFRKYHDRDAIFFLLPSRWEAKGGKVVFYPPSDKNILTTKAFFYHSNYPLIGGLLKGWMPLFPLVLMQNLRKVSLVYSCSEPTLLTTVYFGFWTKLFGRKHVLFSWENIAYEKKFHGIKLMLKRLIVNLNLLFSDGVICGSTKGKEIFSRLTSKPIAVIPMSGVDTKLFSPISGPKEFQGINLEDKIVYTFAGAIGYRKGIHLFLEAFSKIADQLPDAYCIIAGSGEYEREIDRQIAHSSLKEKIMRIPWIKHQELPKLLAISDIFVYPSLPYGGWEEQFGYSMAEASLMELPIVATNSGSIREIVIDGVTGILVKPGSTDELAQAIIYLAKNSDLRRQMGQAGRHHIMSNFSNQIVAQKFYNFFERITSA
ncbi:MAG TPA: glycosyltransferase family 4 protein [Candidatus Paceibacterota bacterium]|nr:glycosyltransferase family 4 protein [Candidatus Paceibacterota bacterium]